MTIAVPSACPDVLSSGPAGSSEVVGGSREVELLVAALDAGAHVVLERGYDRTALVDDATAAHEPCS
ncbi:hypothetical protein [Pseudonocardia endophytica]|uniref:Uncharacterized protein n=1 Tax=Pseudonocardia endophytica TaxID=401976 RepID=A0A4R1I4Q6_PSEEN|nr:hypothetical protein [Pseudonocardia endophytica]TCK27569.1 hypothetical protein EV378_3441 [Pseudonocardia endophytica]